MAANGLLCLLFLTAAGDSSRLPRLPELPAYLRARPGRCDLHRTYPDQPPVSLLSFQVYGTSFAVELLVSGFRSVPSIYGEQLVVYQLDDQLITATSARQVIDLRFEHILPGKHRFVFAATVPPIEGRDVAGGVVCFSIPGGTS